MIVTINTDLNFLDKMILDIEGSPSFKHSSESEPLFKDYRDAYCLSISQDNLLRAAYNQALFYVFNSALRDYLEKLNLPEVMETFLDEGYSYYRYSLGSTCKVHIDGPPAFRQRILTSILYCSPDNSDLVFPVQGTRITPKKGDVVTFPAHLSFPHYTEPQQSFRRVITTFYAYG